MVKPNNRRKHNLSLSTGTTHHGWGQCIHFGTGCSLSHSISFLCTCLSFLSERLLSIDVFKFTGLFPAPSPQIHQLTAASVHSSERPSQTPKCRAEEARGPFNQLNTTSLCVQLTDHRCHRRRMGEQKVSPNSPDLDPGWTHIPFGHLQRRNCECLSDGTGGVGVVGDGNEHTVIHQPAVALLPFRYRYPQRVKAPAASSGRLTHNIGHQYNTAPFSTLRNSRSQRAKRLSMHPYVCTAAHMVDRCFVFDRKSLSTASWSAIRYQRKQHAIHESLEDSSSRCLFSSGNIWVWHSGKYTSLTFQWRVKWVKPQKL